jgi:hypothetical protein
MLLAKIKNLFTKKTIIVTIEEKAEALVKEIGNYATSFEKQTEDALSMFKQTIVNLGRIEASINNKRNTVKNFLDQLTIMDTTLANQQKTTVNIKTKFEDFLK